MPDSYRIAVAQPRALTEPDHSANVGRAVELVAEAAAAGARLVLFPEHSPGPFRAGQDYDAAGPIAEAAAAHGIAVCWSRMELCADDRWRLVVYVTGSDGATVFRYERSHPATVPAGDTGGHVAPGPVLGSFELDGVPMGIAVCSELWIPETTRVLALRGAEVILSPAGGHFTALTSNWQLLARARAIENHCYLALTNNLYGAEQGAAMITGPEHVLVEAGRAELAVATLDLARARWLRDQDDSLAEPKPFDSIPGLLRARRPELYAELAAPRDDLFDYETGR
ncbi:carbon-nitrogen hydrolase family protein [Herbiconiux moechotypicola]|uniref:CN hydrolase domain-containing protein n=1 Tax=Herbiconiux moechotypicola TaxID=637393 RepID=A0ABP5QJ78_9MICO|nr:carbon-nitrogen hydrolase family protein [Herbiconiux moechotypicola]MCS5730068.1 carbon-nitrogen hydrolase family protein [Herbiconiux moechotypicola]